MRQFLGFGNGQDGIATLSGVDAPIDSVCVGTIGTNELTATNTSFAAGQIILIQQIGLSSPTEENYELNQIESYVAGTITTVYPLEKTYTGRSQVIVVKQYASATIASTYTAKLWNGSTGGILAFLVQGVLKGAGGLSATGRGFQGGDSVQGVEQYGKQGEGTGGGGGTQSVSANGNGGGGGGKWDSGVGVGSAGPGAGGGNSTVGGSANDGGSIATSIGGAVSGNTGLTSLSFGGGGGSGGTRFGAPNSSGAGGRGGGIILVHARINLITGTAQANGAVGSDATSGMGAGGGGAGGSIFMKSEQALLSGLTLSAVGAIGGIGGNAESVRGGTGGTGRIRFETCKYVAPLSATPTPSRVEGGFPFCGALASIVE